MSALVFALLAAAGNLAGALILVRHERRSMALIEVCLAFGAGFMLAVAVLEMLPESIAAGGPSAALFILAGYLGVHLAQHVLVPHFHFGEETHHVSASVGISVLLGLLLHTFFDGVAIASGFAVRDSLGLLLFLAVFLHKLPEGLTMASVMLAGHQSRGRALLSAAALGVATILGVLLTEAIAPLRAHGLALSAGVTLYVAASNLVPEIQAKKGSALPLAFFGGALVFFVTRYLVEGIR